VLFPAFAAWLGLYPTVAGAAAVAAAAFDRLVRLRVGTRAWAATTLFAVGLLVPAAIGQFPFLCGTAAGLLALAAGASGHRVVAVAGALACTLFSPVAGVFLVLAAIAWAVTVAPRERALAASVAIASGLPLVYLDFALPGGGQFPFWGSDFFVVVAVCAVGVVLVPNALRPLRTGLALYAVAAGAVFMIPNPLGGNFGRLCAMFAPALTLLLATVRGRRLLAALAVPLLLWQWSPAVSAMTSTSADASSHRAYYRPLLEFLETQPRTGRVEIPFTAGHWEAAFVAPHAALARGWERQLDIADNPLFYGHTPLTSTRYRSWLDANAVQWVALPDVPLDYSAQAEARLLRHAPSYLHLVWSDPHWRVWKVAGSPGIVQGPGSLASLRPDRLVVDARAAGTLEVRVRYTPMWTLLSGAGCIRSAPGGWTRVVAFRPGTITIGTSLIDARGACAGS
jgi:hypothetical protein